MEGLNQLKTEHTIELYPQSKGWGRKRFAIFAPFSNFPDQ
jgi:hypothetical protein